MNISRKQVCGSAIIFFLLIAILSPSAGRASADSYQLGDIITFGTYEQNNNGLDGPEEIAWIVIDQKDGQMMLISKYCIDSQPYHNKKAVIRSGEKQCRGIRIRRHFHRREVE